MPLLLHSFLHTILLLLDVLTNTARNPGELEEKGWAHEGDQVGIGPTKLTSVHPAPDERCCDDDGAGEPSPQCAGESRHTGAD